MAPWAALAALVGAACLAPPADMEQIRDVARREMDAIRRDDVDAAWRLTDLDFRAVCARARYAQVVAARQPATGNAEIVGISEATIRGSRAVVVVEVRRAGVMTNERRQFVKEGGRWYVYGDLDACTAPQAGGRSGGGALWRKYRSRFA